MAKKVLLSDIDRGTLKEMINNHFLWYVTKEERTTEEHAERRSDLIELCAKYYGLDEPADETESCAHGFPVQRGSDYKRNLFFDRLTYMEMIHVAIRNYDKDNTAKAKFITYFDPLYKKANIKYLSNFNENMRKGISLRSDYYSAMNKIAQFSNKAGIDLNRIKDEDLEDFAEKLNRTTETKKYRAKDIKEIMDLSLRLHDKIDIYVMGEEGIENIIDFPDPTAPSAMHESLNIIDAILLLAVNLEDRCQEVLFSSGIIRMIKDENGRYLIESAETDIIRHVVRAYVDYVLELIGYTFQGIEGSDYRAGRKNADKDVADFLDVTKGCISKKNALFRRKKELVFAELFG
ncbi:hypothetical protein MASR2M70_12880 [Bacillota bacterium]